jgi:hypothetical protein
MIVPDDLKCRLCFETNFFLYFQSDAIIQRDRQMRVLRAENERLRQRLERMERRVRGGADVSPSSPAAASPRPPVRIAAAAAATLTSTPVAPPPLVRENAIADNNNKRWGAQKRTAAEAALSASDTDHRQQPPSSAAKMIKLEADVSRHIPAYGGSSRCDFPLAHCDNLTDEIFAESDESFSYCCSTATAATVPDTHRAINGLEAAAAVTAVVTPPPLKHEPGTGGIHADDVVERRRVLTGGVKTSGQLLKQSSVASGEKVKRRAGRPSSHQSLTAPPVPGTVAHL